MHFNDMIHGWGGMWVGPFVVIALVVTLLLIWGFGSTNSSRRRNKPNGDPREILDRRFARGEIDEEEYQRRRGALDS